MTASSVIYGSLYLLAKVTTSLVTDKSEQDGFRVNPDDILNLFKSGLD